MLAQAVDLASESATGERRHPRDRPTGLMSNLPASDADKPDAKKVKNDKPDGTGRPQGSGRSVADVLGLALGTLGKPSAAPVGHPISCPLGAQQAR